jgi:hypothetical protein
MANDSDMYDDIITLDRIGKHVEADFLMACYMAQFVDGNEVAAQTCKEEYVKRFGNWGKYY